MPNISSFRTKEEYTEWYRNYREKNIEKIRMYRNTYRKRNPYSPVKDFARKKLFRAIESGILLRGKCQVCGRTGAEGHHFDYSKPLDVLWLCPTHHKDMHRKATI